ncbi:MAG: hypothetical protein ABL951_13325 [Alphaproteobacteria bacterium]
MPRKNPKFDEMAWKTAEQALVQIFKRQNTNITKAKLRRSLKCEICAKEHPKVDWKKLISKMIDEAKKQGHSTELYEHWLNTRRSSPHIHSQIFTLGDVEDLFERCP